MSTQSALYVRSLGTLALGVIQEQFPNCNRAIGETFIAVILHDPVAEPPMGAGGRLSAELDTDILWLGYQSLVDGFKFHHWRSGRAVRSLVYGCDEAEGLWEQVIGTAEPWEKAAFFSEVTLQQRLSWAITASEREALEQLWRAAVLIPGSNEPGINAQAAAQVVADYYRLPGWH